CTMITVTIDGPLVENGIGLFGVEYFPVRLIVIVIQDGVAVDLARVSRARLQYFARLLGLRNARGSRSGRPPAIIQIQQNHFMAKRGESCNSTAATIFGITGMPACHNDL